MFEDSLFDSGAGRRPRKTGTKLVSFAIESCAVGLLVLLPLIFTQALPQQFVMVEELPPPPRGPSVVRVVHTEMQRPRTTAQLMDSGLHYPGEIPKHVAMEPEEATPSGTPPDLEGLVPGGIPDGVPNAVITQIARATQPVLVKPALPAKLRVSSGVAEGMLVHQVRPQYPQLAVQARIQGTVALQAVIGKDGTVQQLRVVSGHPMLTPAAIEAVKQWRYRPYLLNGEPVEVDTQINVNFTLAGG